METLKVDGSEHEEAQSNIETLNNKINKPKENLNQLRRICFSHFLGLIFSVFIHFFGWIL